ncbi:MAG TPA: thiol reductant ABC exporter subunit CydD [Acidimicrobiales bacterium]|nr:thiol reductant ABC exporter subunit CydD [Acidimicrobiales bacterium]
MRDASPTAGSRNGGPFDRALIRELPGLTVNVGASVVVGLLATASVVAQAVALANLLASAVPGSGPRPPDRAGWFVLLVAGAGVRALAAVASEVVAALGASRVKAGLRSRLVVAALDHSVAREKGGPGDLATLAGRGLDALDVYVGRCLPDLVLAVVAPIALLVAVGVLDWVSAIVMAVVVALFPVFGALVGKMTMQLAGERWRRVEQLGRQIADLIQGLPALRALGRTAEQRASIARANEALRSSSSKVLRVAFLSALVLDTLGSVSIALVAVPLGLRLLTGSVRLSAALAVLILAPEVFLPLRRASAEFHESTEGLAAASRAIALTRSEAASGGSFAPHLSPPDPGRAPVRLRCVSLQLAGRDNPVLDGASLTVAPGETVLLLGESGSGKSSTLSLLLGFLVPTGGEVTVGGEDLRNLDLDEWRRLVTYLPEHPTLLRGTLAANLRLANPDASDEELSRALTDAGSPELVGSLPDGLATQLGDGGRTVSAGERQRIALARVLLRRASLFLLDEPTVHLDQTAEAAVLEGLSRALAGRSALIVSHRPAVARIADRVVVLRGGKFAEVVAAGAIVPAGAQVPGAQLSACALGTVPE